MKRTTFLSTLILLVSVYACEHTGTTADNTEPQKQKSVAIKNDTVTIFNESSQTTSEVPFKDGLKDGLAKQYYPEGGIWKESNYANGVLNGIATVYERDGSLKRKVEYKNGKKDGEYIKYFKSGNPKMIAHYKDDLIQTGIVEKDYKGETVVQPTILMREEDRMLTENTYSVAFSLDKSVKDIRYYAFDEPGKWTTSTDMSDHQLPIRKKNGATEGFIELEVRPGYYLALKLYVYATYITKAGNEAVVYKEFNIAAENRTY